MAYYLTVKRGKENIPLDITSLEMFKRISNNKKGFSLEEIDRCTMFFRDEYQFKEHLLENNIIELEDITRDLSIRSKRNDKLEKVEYGLAYSTARKYFDVQCLSFILLSKQKDIRFLNKLLAHYRNSYINNMNLCILRDAITTSNIELIIIKLRDFYMSEITKTDKNTGEVKINYKAFHDLAMFIYSYDVSVSKEENNISKEEDKLERKLALEYLMNSLAGSNTQTKKKIKTKELEGQINLF